MDKCFTPEIKIEGEDPILTKDLQTSEKIFKPTTDNNNPTVGIMTIDGMPMVLSFDQDCERLDPLANTPRNTSGTSATLACMHILYDTNGIQKPNTYGKDIRGYQIDLDVKQCLVKTKDGVCFSQMAIVSKPLTRVECEAQKGELGIKYCDYDEDYWAGVKQQCKAQGKRLANENELASLANHLYNTTTASGSASDYVIDISGKTLNTTEAGKLGLPTSGYFFIWSSLERNSYNSYERYFNATSSVWNYTSRGNVFLGLCMPS